MYRLLRIVFRTYRGSRQKKREAKYSLAHLWRYQCIRIRLLRQQRGTYPNADSLASRGIQFMNAWSVAPQSSAARSSLITGCYSSTYGMDIHPVPLWYTRRPSSFPRNCVKPDIIVRTTARHIIIPPPTIKYVGTSATTRLPTTVQNGGKESTFLRRVQYGNFTYGTHSYFPHRRTKRLHAGRYLPTLLSLPSYVPDLPEVRSDYAGHLEAVQDVDIWLGLFLKDLKERGLDENTIIFFFSDHGGCVPRGKGYLYESGLRVPL